MGTLIYLHPFKTGLSSHVKKAEVFRVDGLRIVMPVAPRLPISFLGAREVLSWYDYLTDHHGEKEDELCEKSLAHSRAILEPELTLVARAAKSRGEAAAPRLMLGGLSQGCGMTLDVALRWREPLLGFVGVLGHPLDA